MPPGRTSRFNNAQQAIIASYIPAFEAKVLEVDPGLNGNSKEVSAWKSATAEVILTKSEFQGLTELGKWREVSRFSTTRHIVLAN